MTPETSACLDEQTLAGFVCGELEAGALRRVEAHLAGCADCRGVAADAAHGVGGSELSYTQQPEAGWPKPGAVLAGKYRIEELLGQGGMGVVFGAQHIELGHRVAIKVLPSKDPLAAARFLREAKTCAQLVNDHIVRVFDLGRLPDGAPYFVMEHLRGRDLASRIARERLPVALAVQYLLQVCAALKEAHAMGVIHRDLKPGNLFLVDRSDGQPWLKVLDFGISKLISSPLAQTQQPSLTLQDTVLGSPLYMSPEQIRGSKELDARSDIWSLGVIAYELMTRHRPFKAPTLASALIAIATEEPPRPSSLVTDLPAGLEAVVLRCLEKDLDRRFGTVDVLREALVPFAGGNAAGSALLAASHPEPAPPSFNHHPLSPKIPAHNLPVELTRFIGRQAELALIERLILDPETRLLTILGPGGMGKSRLASEVGRLLASGGRGFRDGIFWVELAPLSSASLLASALGEALSYTLSPRGDLQRQLVDYLRAKNLLLVMDNFEHLIDGSSLVDELLRAAPGVKVLATSREPLALRAERQHVLSGLSVPEHDFAEHMLEHPGVELFIDAVRRRRLDFEPTHEDLRAIARIGRLAQGMPLALVLAASWTSLLSLPEIVEELRSGLDFLQTEMSDVPERQRSLRAVFEHSWKLLDDEERRVFAALSVFRGGFVRNAAAAVARATLADLASLQNKSLLWRARETCHYRVHELLRQYAEVKLAQSGEDEATRDRHASYYANLLKQGEEDLRRADAHLGLNEIDAEIDNVRAAWRWMITRNQVDQLQDCIEGMNLFYRRRGPFIEAAEAFGHAASLADSAPHTEKQAWIVRSALRMQSDYTKDYPKAAELAAKALSLIPEDASNRERATALLTACTALGRTAQMTQALEFGEQALQLFRASEHRWELAHALGRVAIVWIKAGEYDHAKRCYRESSALLESQGASAAALMDNAIGLGWLLALEGERSEGHRWLLRGLALAERRRDAWNEAGCLVRLAHVERSMGRYRDAEGHAERCLELSRRLGHPVFEAWSLRVVGDVCREEARYEEAAASYRESEIRTRQSSDVGGHAWTRFAQGRLALVAADYVASRHLLSESRHLFQSLGIRVGELVAFGGLGYLTCYEGDYGKAREFFRRALETTALRALSDLCHIVAGVGLCCARTQRPERAVELLSLTSAHYATECYTRVRYIEPLLQELESTLDEDAFAAAMARGKVLGLETGLRVILQLREDAGR